VQNYTSQLNVPLQTMRTTLSTGAVTTSITNRPIRKASVSSSAIVQGDHVHPNSWSYSVLRCYNGDGYMNNQTRTYRYDIHSGPLADIGLPTPGTGSSSLYNDLISRLNDKVRGGIDLSVDAFQAKQTARMFNATSRVEDLARVARRRGRGIPKLIGSAWLELQYGWRPLLGTIHDAGEKLLGHTVERLSFSVSVKENLGPPKADKRALGSSQFQLLREVNYGGNRIDGYRAKIKMKASQEALTYVAGFTSLNPLSIAWELVPYSFVVDWFIDIGGYLRNVETALLYNSLFDSGYITRLRAGNINAHAAWSEKTSSGMWDATQEYRVLSRTKLTNYPFPNIPSFRAKLGSGRLLNAAALLSQRLR